MKKLSYLALIAALCLAGCSDSSSAGAPTPTPAPQYSIGNFAYIKADNNGLAQLMNWQLANPNKRITNITGELAYRADNSAYIIQFAPGDNRTQKVTVIQTNGSTTYLTVLQDWTKQHEEYQITAFASIPSYSGGIQGYIICYEPKHSKDDGFIFVP